MQTNAKSQTKSKQRVKDHGEVFTNEREVKAMCDLVKDETECIDSRFLEPACGDGNFLAEILCRKLQTVKRKYSKSPPDYEKNAILALSSVYGVDILFDNVLACRKRLFEIWNSEYSSVCNKIKIYGVYGIKGGAKRKVDYVALNSVNDKDNNLKNFKLFFSKAYMTTSTVPPEVIVANPYEICTETFLQIGGFNTLLLARNCLSYIKTKFFRALLFYNRHSLNISKDSFKLIPMQDFSKPWTDEELYKKYNLTQEEINFIESMIRPME